VVSTGVGFVLVLYSSTFSKSICSNTAQHYSTMSIAPPTQSSVKAVETISLRCHGESGVISMGRVLDAIGPKVDIICVMFINRPSFDKSNINQKLALLLTLR